jgi:hypothetical protein
MLLFDAAFREQLDGLCLWPCHAADEERLGNAAADLPMWHPIEHLLDITRQRDERRP